MLQLTFNPGLRLTGFRTTQPWCTRKANHDSLNFSTSVTNKTSLIVHQNNRFRICSYWANHLFTPAVVPWNEAKDSWRVRGESLKQVQGRIQGRWNGWIFTPLFLSPLLSFFFSYPSNIEIIVDFSDIITKIHPPFQNPGSALESVLTFPFRRSQNFRLWSRDPLITFLLSNVKFKQVTASWWPVSVIKHEPSVRLHTCYTA